MINLSGELYKNLSFVAGIIKHEDYWYNTSSGDFPASLRSEFQLRYDPGEFLAIIFNLRQKRNKVWILPEHGIKTGKDNTVNNIRISLKLNMPGNLTLSSRFETVGIPESDEKGYMFYETIDYRLADINLRFIARVCVFSTDNYATRIYAWENDLLYNPVVTSLYNSGTRSYILVVYKPCERITLRGKYSLTAREGSYLRHETKLQMIFTF